MNDPDLIHSALARRVVEYSNQLTDEAGKLTVVQRRQIASALQAEGLAVGRWRCGHMANGFLVLLFAIATVLGIIDTGGGTLVSVARVMAWGGTIGLVLTVGFVWKLAGRAIDYPIGMYGLMLISMVNDKASHESQAPSKDSEQ